MAHCLFNDDKEEMLPASSFSIMLGVHNRRNTREASRLGMGSQSVMTGTDDKYLLGLRSE